MTSFSHEGEAQVAISVDFTPGPWEAWTAPDGAGVVKRVFRDEQNRRVTQFPAVCNCAGLPNGANAALVAAAPELYAELQQFVNGVETRMIDSPADETLANITHRARKALSKARGEQVVA